LNIFGTLGVLDGFRELISKLVYTNFFLGGLNFKGAVIKWEEAKRGAALIVFYRNIFYYM